MPLLAEKNIATPQAFKQSILIDPQVYHWFLHLIFKPDVKKKLSSLEDLKKKYKTLFLSLAVECIVFISLLGLLTSIVFFKDFTYLWIGVFFLLILIFPYFF